MTLPREVVDAVVMKPLDDGERHNTLRRINYDLVDRSHRENHPVRQIEELFGIVVLLFFQLQEKRAKFDADGVTFDAW